MGSITIVYSIGSYGIMPLCIVFSNAFPPARYNSLKLNYQVQSFRRRYRCAVVFPHTLRSANAALNTTLAKLVLDIDHKHLLSTHTGPWTYSSVPTDYTSTCIIDVDTEPDGSRVCSSTLHELCCGVAGHSHSILCGVVPRHLVRGPCRQRIHVRVQRHWHRPCLR